MTSKLTVAESKILNIFNKKILPILEKYQQTSVSIIGTCPDCGQTSEIFVRLDTESLPSRLN